MFSHASPNPEEQSITENVIMSVNTASDVMSIAVNRRQDQYCTEACVLTGTENYYGWTSCDLHCVMFYFKENTSALDSCRTACESVFLRWNQNYIF